LIIFCLFFILGFLIPLGITVTNLGYRLSLKIMLFLVVLETAIILSQEGSRRDNKALKWISIKVPN